MKKPNFLATLRAMLFGIILASVSGLTNAEILSEHNEYHAADNTARQYLSGLGCEWAPAQRVERYRVITSSEGVHIMSNDVFIPCGRRWTGGKLVFDRPLSREDGTRLSRDEIDKFTVELKTVDVNGLVSKPAYYEIKF